MKEVVIVFKMQWKPPEFNSVKFGKKGQGYTWLHFKSIVRGKKRVSAIYLERGKFLMKLITRNDGSQ